MSVAVLFPGQGEALHLCVRSWYVASPPVKRLIDVAAHALDTEAAVLFERACRFLARTEYLQPVSTALGLGIFEEIARRTARPDVVAGHSLGEVPAISAAGWLPADEAVVLAALRGRLMAAAARAHPGGMLAVATSREDELAPVIAEGARRGMLAVAAYNSPSQTAVSGESEALGVVRRMLPAVRLTVAGAWHSPVMADAVDPFRDALSKALSRMPAGDRIPMVFNRTGRITSSRDLIPRLLSDQLTHPVLWTRSMRELRDRGVTCVVTVGPARVLRGMVRDFLGSSDLIRPVEEVRDLDRLPEPLTT